MRKIPAGAEASNILVGEVDFLDKTLSAFIRLSQAGIMGDLTEVPVPTRFIFVLLGPTVRRMLVLLCTTYKKQQICTYLLYICFMSDIRDEEHELFKRIFGFEKSEQFNIRF